MDARQSKQIKRISKKQENQVAEELGGKVQAASGATRLGGGGDVRASSSGVSYRVECKFTTKPAYTLKLSELEKLKKQANTLLEFPLFQFCFRSHLSRLELHHVLIPWDDKLEPDKELIVTAKQTILSKEFLKTIQPGKPFKLVFNTPKLVRAYRLMSWDEFKEVEGNVGD